MSDSLSFVLAAAGAGLAAFVAADPSGLSDTAQAIIAGVVAFLAAVAVKRPGRQSTPLR